MKIRFRETFEAIQWTVKYPHPATTTRMNKPHIWVRGHNSDMGGYRPIHEGDWIVQEEGNPHNIFNVVPDRFWLQEYEEV